MCHVTDAEDAPSQSASATDSIVALEFSLSPFLISLSLSRPSITNTHTYTYKRRNLKLREKIEFLEKLIFV